ncbi:hypothetical protein P700755_003730 [Psychroflexus torquis ATCC 700755]|uniref:Uncharacterized protein n=1 Tax=Psychroflexus torquis (strain ATCC 700755 / CIP 106069 / ACAM 623) TaxID=313595 RepID=K4IIC6_PSYTT|nr:hypothetical protein P700755_003730 [Psychroflexus torquis ATCC 700755]
MQYLKALLLTEDSFYQRLVPKGTIQNKKNFSQTWIAF